MRRYCHFLLSLVVAVAIYFFPTQQVLAVDDFSTSYDVSYKVHEDGVTDALEKITIKNLTSKYYISDYSLTIGSTTVTDVTASDDNGKIEPQIDSKDGKTSIKVKFNQPIAGKDKIQNLTLKFKTKDFAGPVGKIWEVNLPKMPSAEAISAYNLSLEVPISFGDPISVHPIPKTQTSGIDKQILNFSKDQLVNSGVSVTFGQNQFFDFDLSYKLENKSMFPVITSVALPPDTQYQDIAIASLNPSPLNVTIDEDGNYLAWYKLARNGVLPVNVKGIAKLYIKNKSDTIYTLDDSAFKQLTKSDRYWEKDNPAITATLRDIFQDGLPGSKEERVRLIYRYVINALKYNRERLDQPSILRLGAVTSVNNPDKALCMEFTDLFIALARAVDVPARELDGYAYSQNSELRPLSSTANLLHTWPEYYNDEKGWVMIDPTWEQTSGGVDYFNKFDLNHLVLVVKGRSSTIPYTSDNVKVEVSKSDFKGGSEISTQISVPDILWAGIPYKLKVKVLNSGTRAQSPQQLTIVPQGVNITGEKSVTLSTIPPSGYTALEYTLQTANLWQSTEATIDVYVSDQKFSKTVKISPFYNTQSFRYILGGFLSVIFGMYIVTLLIHIKLQKKKS